MNQPNEKELLSTLVKLLAEQEGVKINCEIKEVGKEEEK